ncbi:hypothetical protein LJR235_001938 [Pararhizobium sp. LjRoot235]|uniref:hypothetical protein n=1 Tax=Pararhizobium sp. LjRoot235 TaxID=3342291 RepID=UPI003ECC6D2B
MILPVLGERRNPDLHRLDRTCSIDEALRGAGATQSTIKETAFMPATKLRRYRLILFSPLMHESRDAVIMRLGNTCTLASDQSFRLRLMFQRS